MLSPLTFSHSRLMSAHDMPPSRRVISFLSSSVHSAKLPGAALLLIDGLAGALRVRLGPALTFSLSGVDGLPLLSVERSESLSAVVARLLAAGAPGWGVMDVPRFLPRFEVDVGSGVCMSDGDMAGGEGVVFIGEELGSAIVWSL